MDSESRKWALIGFLGFAIMAMITLAITLSAYLFGLHGGKYESMGIVIDAGSSSTKAYLYKWKGDWSDGEKTIMTVQEIGSEKSKYPLALVRGNVSNEVKNHFDPLIKALEKNFPDSAKKSISISLGATAGMRSLEQTDKKLCDLILNETRLFLSSIGYKTKSKDIRMISGYEEGLYAWYTLNILLAKLDPRTKQIYTDGVLDMGGGSMQIAFAKDPNNLSDTPKNEVPLFQEKLDLFVKSFNCSGADFSYLIYLRSIAEASPKNNLIDDPCAVKGSELKISSLKIHENPCSAGSTVIPANMELSFKGTGDYDLCGRKVDHAIPKSVCSANGCEFIEALVPAINENLTTFKLIGSFYYSWKNLNSPIGELAYDKALKELCEETVINPNDFRRRACFDAFNAKTILQRLGVSQKYYGAKETEPIDKIGGSISRGWALGYMLAINEALPKSYPIWSKRAYRLSLTLLAVLIGVGVIVAAMGLAAGIAVFKKPKKGRTISI